VLSKALDILELLQTENQPKSLEEIYQRTNISKTTVNRILKTFTHRGYLAQSETVSTGGCQAAEGALWVRSRILGNALFGGCPGEPLHRRRICRC
jgi:DNA-binding IclR family transcriptional regulator